MSRRLILCPVEGAKRPTWVTVSSPEGQTRLYSLTSAKPPVKCTTTLECAVMYLTEKATRGEKLPQHVKCGPCGDTLMSPEK